MLNENLNRLVINGHDPLVGGPLMDKHNALLEIVDVIIHNFKSTPSVSYWYWENVIQEVINKHHL